MAPNRSSLGPSTSAPVRPIVLGGDLGAYATARAFHQAYGVRTVVVAGASVGPVRHSRVVDLRIAPLATPADLLAVLRAIADEEPHLPHLVLASADWLVQELTRIALDLIAVAPNVTVPYPSAQVVERVANKAVVMRECERLSIPHPETIILTLTDSDGASPADQTHALAPTQRWPELDEVVYPRVVKVASTAAAHAVDYPGQAKVHRVADAGQARDLLARMAHAGLRGDVLVQEVLPGGDASMAAANLFVARDGRVVFGQFGRVLLEEHTPTALGNSVAQVTVDVTEHPEAAEVLESVASLVRELDWRGFANVDLMADADGRYRVLEINPRVGRSGFAVTASGYSVARMYVREFLDSGIRGERVWGEREHLFTVVPLWLLRVFAPQAWPQVRALRRRRRVTNPLFYRAETDPRRWWYIAVAMANQARKFARFHPASPLRRG